MAVGSICVIQQTSHITQQYSTGGLEASDETEPLEGGSSWFGYRSALESNFEAALEVLRKAQVVNQYLTWHPTILEITEEILFCLFSSLSQSKAVS